MYTYITVTMVKYIFDHDTPRVPCMHQGLLIC